MIDADAALEFMSRWDQAQRSQDFAEVAPLLHTDIVVRFNDGDHAGLDAVRAAIEETWALPIEDDDYAMSDVRVAHVGTDSATVMFSWRWSGSWDGQPFEANGRGTAVLVLEGSELRLVLEHLSRD